MKTLSAAGYREKKLFLQRKNLHLFGRLICSILTTNIPPILVLTGCL